MEKTDEVDLLIIGAGLHGLIMAKTYLQVNPAARLLLVDVAQSIGGTWAAERLYPGLKTNNVVGSYEFADFPMIPERYEMKAGQHIPGEVVHSYFCDFVERYGLKSHIQLETRVFSAKLGEGGTWSIQLGLPGDSTPSQTLLAKRMVVATGLTSTPNLPIFPDQQKFQRPIFHAKELRKRSSWLSTRKTIVVVGGNKSAWDTCYTAAAQHGGRVHMLLRPDGAGPTYVWPRTFTWGGFQLSLPKLIATRVFAFLDPSPFGRTALSGWIRKLFHQTRLGRAICELFWLLLDRRIRKWHRFDDHPETETLAPWTTPFWIGNSVSTHNYETPWLDLVRKGLISVHYAEICDFDGHNVCLSSGECIAAEAVICCTGWQSAHSIHIDPPEASGLATDMNSADVSADIERATQFVEKEAPYLSTWSRRTPNAPEIQCDLQKNEETKSLELYRFMVPWQLEILQRRCIAFMGMATTINAAVAAEVQALWVTAYFANRISHLRPPLADADHIRYETILQLVYNRLRRPRETGGAGGKYPELVFDSMTYIDTMMIDLGLQHLRKSSCWREYFEQYGPKDYTGLVDQWVGDKIK